MKRTMFLMLSLAVVAGMTGCVAPRGHRMGTCADGSCVAVPDGRGGPDCCGATCDGCQAGGGAACDSCSDPNGAPCGDPCAWGKCKKAKKCKTCKGRPPEGPPQEFNPGPPAAQVAYPYYTIRGPRDFLARNPSSIGP
jgi:hypothetical protein